MRKKHLIVYFYAVLLTASAIEDTGGGAFKQQNTLGPNLKDFPKLPAEAERDLQRCTRILFKKLPLEVNDKVAIDQMFYGYFTCVENVLLRRKVVSFQLKKFTWSLVTLYLQISVSGVHPLHRLPNLYLRHYRNRRQVEDEGIYHGGIQIGAYGDQGTGRSAKPPLEDGSLSSLLKNPAAVKMVLKYLTKQKLDEHKKSWSLLAEEKRRKEQKKAVKKKVEKPKIPPFLIPVKTDNSPPKITEKIDKGPKLPKRKRPDLSSLFGLLLAGAKGKKSSRPSKTRKPSSSAPIPLTPPKDLDNPLLQGLADPKLEYFGPSDFVPKHRYHLPMQEHGPMKLRYMSAKEFPNVEKYGLIPIPR